MPSLDATPGSATANAFLDESDASEYMDNRLNASAWTGASIEDRERALIEASRELSLLAWGGYRTDTTQALSWPRWYALNPDLPSIYSLSDLALLYYADDAIPQRLLDATCELALEFLKAGTTDVAALDRNAGVIEKTVGPLTTRWAEGQPRAQGLARYPRVLSLIAPLLASVGGLELIRT